MTKFHVVETETVEGDLEAWIVDGVLLWTGGFNPTKKVQNNVNPEPNW